MANATGVLAPREKNADNKMFSKYPVAASTKLWKGTGACINASGNAIKMGDTSAAKFVGKVEETADNSGGAAGDIYVTVSYNYELEMDINASAITGADPMTVAMAGADDHTVTDAGDATNDVEVGVIRSLSDTSGKAWIGLCMAPVNA
jgi:hypothetical protein